MIEADTSDDFPATDAEHVRRELLEDVDACERLHGRGSELDQNGICLTVEGWRALLNPQAPNPSLLEELDALVERGNRTSDDLRHAADAVATFVAGVAMILERHRGAG